MKSVENILGYNSLEKIFEMVQENTLNCSKLIHFGQQKLSFNQNVWRGHATMQQCFVAFLGDISILKSG